MKVNLFMFGDGLAFSFKKTDVKTAEDRTVMAVVEHEGSPSLVRIKNITSVA